MSRVGAINRVGISRVNSLDKKKSKNIFKHLFRKLCYDGPIMEGNLG